MGSLQKELIQGSISSNLTWTKMERMDRHEPKWTIQTKVN